MKPPGADSPAGYTSAVAGLVCSECSKPTLPGARVCRWCKGSLVPRKAAAAPDQQEEPGAKTPPAVAAELQEISTWSGPAREIAVPAVSVRTWIVLVLAIAGLIAAVALPTTQVAQGVMKVMAMLGGGFCALLLIVWGSQDLQAIGTRARRTPQDAALACFLRLKAKQSGAARAALADYSAAENRHRDLAGRWKERLTGGFEISTVIVTGMEEIRPDAAVVNLRIDLRAGSLPGLLVGMFAGCVVGIVLYFALAKKDLINVEKLLLLRDGRWYVANALPEDRTDRRLIRALTSSKQP